MAKNDFVLSADSAEAPRGDNLSHALRHMALRDQRCAQAHNIFSC